MISVCQMIISSRYCLPKSWLLNWKICKISRGSWEQLGNLHLDKTSDLEQMNTDISMESKWLMCWNVGQELLPQLY